MPRYRVTLVATNTVHVIMELDSTHEGGALHEARKRFEKVRFDAEGVVGTENHGWVIPRRKPENGGSNVEELPEPGAGNEGSNG